MALTDDVGKSFKVVMLLKHLGIWTEAKIKTAGEGEGYSKNWLMLYLPEVCDFSRG